MKTVDLFSRSAGLVSPAVADAHVAVIGCGSVGSYVVELLARTGVGRFTIVDPDLIEPHNVSRSLFSTRDIGRSKVQVVGERVASVNPDAEVTIAQTSFQALPFDSQRSICEEATLIVAATDDNAAQLRIAHCGYWAMTPVVSIGLYRNADGGEVILSVPGHACWSCATVDLRDESVQRTNDYGTGRLMAIPGLLGDIHFVSSCAAKLALGLVETDPNASVKALTDHAMRMSTTYLLLGMTPNYWVFKEMLDSSPGQLAFQSIWVKVDSRPGCPICGDARVDPYSVSRAPTGADRAALREILHTGDPRVD